VEDKSTKRRLLKREEEIKQGREELESLSPKGTERERYPI
jgi:hypothetical protein